MTRKEKAQRNDVQRLFYSKYSEAVNKNELEQLADAIAFLENISINPNNIQQHQNTLHELKLLVSFNMLLKVTSEIWTQFNEDANKKDFPSTSKELDVSKLYAGQIIKNFNELCTLVSFKKPDGKRQREQYKKKFSRYFDFVEMEYSNQIVILEIYEEPLAKAQTYSGKFLNEIKYIILNYLIHVANNNPAAHDSDGYYELRTTYSRLMKKDLQLISPLFDEHIGDDYLLDSFFSQNYADCFQHSNVKYNLIVLSNRLYTKIRGAISTALRRLSSVDEMITLEEGYEAKIQSSCSFEWKPISSKKDKTYLLNTMKDVAYNLGYKNSWQCRWHGKQKEFETELFKRTLKDKGWGEVRFRIKIGFNYLHLLKYMDEFSDYVDYRQSFFTNMAAALNSQALDWYNKEKTSYLEGWNRYLNIAKEYSSHVSIDELWEEYEAKNYHFRRYKDDFVDGQKLLTDYIINPDDIKKQELIQYKRCWIKHANESKLCSNLTASEENDLYLDFEEDN